MKIGSHYRKGECQFFAWAPLARELSLRVVFPRESVHPMLPAGNGYWKTILDGIAPGARYFYELDPSLLRPDPASHFQPEGVHGPSEVVDHSAFEWTDGGWRGPGGEIGLIYELHTGTFTPEGTFAAVIPRLQELRELGVGAIELMPVAQFPGKRNWGYDGAFLFAVQESYGGPRGLKELVNECHRLGLAVVLDVVYNHLGPEGNYLGDFGPYFSNRCSTPWGLGINFDGPCSDEVRNFVLRNAEFWFYHYHIDALRLDAVQHITDLGTRHILAELADRTAALSRRLGRRLLLFAESDQNDVRLVESRARGGYALDAQWLDDFHHCVHALLTGESSGYYADYGSVFQLAKAIRSGFVYSWDYSRFRKKHYGSSSRNIPRSRFIVFNQNHDQVGNRLFGERLPKLVPFEALKLAAGLLFSVPYIPMIFMGEEYAEDSPFLYFVDHSDANLLHAVAEGRKNEFRSFVWQAPPPEPHAVSTFDQSRLGWQKRYEGGGKAMREYYFNLISRKKRRGQSSGAGQTDFHFLVADEARKLLVFASRRGESLELTCASFSPEAVGTVFNCPWPGLRRSVDSAERRWLGPGSVSPGSLEEGENKLELRGYNFVSYSNE